MIKHFDSKMIFFGLDEEKSTSYGQKYFRQTNNFFVQNKAAVS